MVIIVTNKRSNCTNCKTSTNISTVQITAYQSRNDMIVDLIVQAYSLE